MLICDGFFILLISVLICFQIDGAFLVVEFVVNGDGGRILIRNYYDTKIKGLKNNEMKFKTKFNFFVYIYFLYSTLLLIDFVMVSIEDSDQ